MNYPSEFLNFLESNNISFNDFAYVIFGILLAVYFVYHVPFWIMSLSTFLLVINGFWSDKKRDKFLWHTQNYLYRTCLNLYDEKGYCIKTFYYKFLLKKYGSRRN